MIRNRAVGRRTAVFRSAWMGWLVVGWGVFQFVVTEPCAAQDRNSVVTILRESRNTRLRVQAALTLGRLRHASARPALERALSDDSAAVRAAAATALRRIGSRSSLPALRRAQRDRSSAVRTQVRAALRSIRRATRDEEAETPNQGRRGRRPALHATAAGTFPSVSVVPTEPTVRWSRVRYVVTLGNMDTAEETNHDLDAELRQGVLEHLRSVRGTAVYTSASALDARAQREIERRSIPTFRLNARVREVDVSRRGSELSVRCEVTLMLLDDGESIRGELTGAASGRGRSRRSPRREQERALTERALDGAVQSALARAPVALAEASRR